VVTDYGAKEDVFWHSDEEEIEWGGLKFRLIEGEEVTRPQI